MLEKLPEPHFGVGLRRVFTFDKSHNQAGQFMSSGSRERHKEINMCLSCQ